MVEAFIPVLSCGITSESTYADQTQMVTEPWVSCLCALVFWRRDAGPSLAENVTYTGTANTSVEEYISLTLVNSVLLGMDHFNSGPGVHNLTQSHLLKPSELTRKLPLDVVEASIPVLSCGITNGSTFVRTKRIW